MTANNHKNYEYVVQRVKENNVIGVKIKFNITFETGITFFENSIARDLKPLN